MPYLPQWASSRTGRWKMKRYPDRLEGLRHGRRACWKKPSWLSGDGEIICGGFILVILLIRSRLFVRALFLNVVP
jgi:hypothetical protein